MSERRVLLVASEAHPLAKTGGLGDYVAGLAKALVREDCDVRLLLPGYPEACERLTGRARRVDLASFPGLGGVSLVEGEMPGSAIPVWLLDCPALYHRPGGLYQDAEGIDWPDNAERFALLSSAGAHIACTGGMSG